MTDPTPPSQPFLATAEPEAVDRRRSLATIAVSLASLVAVSPFAAGDYRRLVTTGVSPAILLACAIAIGALWKRRHRTVPDLWLFTVLWMPATSN